MPVCSYLVLPEAGAKERVYAHLTAMADCEVVSAANRDVLLLVTDTESLEAEETLRRSLEAERDIGALLLTFGEIEPDTELEDRLRALGYLKD